VNWFWLWLCHAVVEGLANGIHKKLLKCFATGDILLGQTQEYDPGDLGVPDGARMTIYVDVVAGSNNAGRHHFTYQKGNPHKGDYVITGTTLDNFLGLIGIS
jgi:hypothetical protein